MRAVHVEVIGPEKRVRPQRQCETILLLKSLPLKMSESKISESEFYYPGELSDAEMLQLPGHSEATEGKSLLWNHSNHSRLRNLLRANNSQIP